MNTLTRSLLAAALFWGGTAHAAVIASYQFSGNANDSTGNFNATVNGATLTTDRFGNADSAYLFNGSSNSIATGIQRASYTEDFSISAWFRYDGSAAANYQPIVAGQFGPFFLGKELGNTNLSMQNSNHLPNAAPGTNAWNGDWHQVLAVFDASSPGSALTGSIFLDGLLVACNLAYGTAAQAAGLLFIGHEVVNPTVYFTGAIDAVTFYDNAFDATAAANLFDSESTQASIPNPGAMGLLLVGGLALMSRRPRQGKMRARRSRSAPHKLKLDGRNAIPVRLSSRAIQPEF